MLGILMYRRLLERLAVKLLQGRLSDLPIVGFRRQAYSQLRDWKCEAAVDTVSELLLRFYKAAEEQPPEAFFSYAMESMQSILRFDSGGRSLLAINEGKSLIQGADLYCEETAMLAHWHSVSSADPVLATAISRLGNAISYNTDALTRSVVDAEFLGYVSNHRHHQNGVVLINQSDRNETFDALGFYRRHADAMLTSKDADLVTLLGPHLIQAGKINRRIYGVQDYPLLSAIFHDDGRLYYATPGVRDLLRAEWHGWAGKTIPPRIREELNKGNAAVLKSPQLTLQTARYGGLIVMHVRRNPTVSCLSARELMVAHLFAEGISTKVIARQMNIAPSTARNFLAQVYRKLNINNRTSLAGIVNTK